MAAGKVVEVGRTEEGRGTGAGEDGRKWNGEVDF